MDLRRRAVGCTAVVAVCLAAAGGGARFAPAASSPPPFVVGFTPDTPEGSGASLRALRVDGSDIRMLTSGADLDVPGEWSPDGSRIAFERIDGSRIYSSVGVVGLDGTRETRTVAPASGKRKVLVPPLRRLRRRRLLPGRLVPRRLDLGVVEPVMSDADERT